MHSAAVSSLFLHFKRTFEIGPSLTTYPPSNPALDGNSSCQLAHFKNMLQLLLDNFTMMGKQARVSKNGTLPGLGSIKQLRVILVILPLPLCMGYRKLISSPRARNEVKTLSTHHRDIHRDIHHLSTVPISKTGRRDETVLACSRLRYNRVSLLRLLNYLRAWNRLELY